MGLCFFNEEKLGQRMTEDKPDTCKIYRLIDTNYPIEHSDHVRYVGRTCRKIEGRFHEHLLESQRVLHIRRTQDVRGMMNGPRVRQFDLSKLEVQLVESVSTKRESIRRERAWVELHKKAGYNLLNTALMKSAIFPEGFLDPIGIREYIESKVKDAAQGIVFCSTG